MNPTSDTPANHYFCCACHITPDEHCDECKHLCVPANPDLDKQVDELFIALVPRRYPWEEELKQALTTLLEREKRKLLESLPRYTYSNGTHEGTEAVPAHIIDDRLRELREGEKNA